jgi:hypothetical protein
MRPLRAGLSGLSACMICRPLCCVWLAVAAAVPLACGCAQSLTIMTASLAPMVANAQVAGAQVTDSRPVGPLPANFLLSAYVASSAGDAAASFGMLVMPSQQSVSVRGSAFAVSSSPPSAATTNLIDVLVLVQATSPVMAFLQVDRTLVASAGVAVPVQRIDVGNDGSFEISETTPSSASVANIALGPVAVPVRVLMQVAASGAQQVVTNMTLRFIADNHLAILPQGFGCSGYPFAVEPSFVGTGIRVSQDSSHPSLFNDLVVAVLGIGVQPILLPSAFPGCLLVPTPQVLALIPPAASLQVPLPAAVRPISFWAQGVVLWGSGHSSWGGDLLTTMAYRVDAY